MHVTFDYSALHYLNLWLRGDREICELASGDSESQRIAIEKTVANYRVARNLHRKYDVEREMKRFEPVRLVINSVSESQLKSDPMQLIQSCRKQINSRYGNRDTLSLTTKVLWTRFKSPIVIYDNQVRKALGTAAGDWPTYHSCWKKAYAANGAGIKTACRRLRRASRYAIDPAVATPEYIENISAKTWFQERVLDTYLWHAGSS